MGSRVVFPDYVPNRCNSIHCPGVELYKLYKTMKLVIVYTVPWCRVVSLHTLVLSPFVFKFQNYVCVFHWTLSSTRSAS